MFGLVKKNSKRIYEENRKQSLKSVVAEIMNDFNSYDMRSIFKKCGYTSSGFNPGIAHNIDIDFIGFRNAN